MLEIAAKKHKAVELRKGDQTKIRIAEQRDACQLLELLRSTMPQWSHYYTEDYMYNRIMRKEVHVTDRHDMLVGTISFTAQNMWEFVPDKKFVPNFGGGVAALYIDSLAVLPAYEGQGIGTQLLDFAETTAKNNKEILLTHLRLNAVPDRTTFYTKRGYKVIGFANVTWWHEPVNLLEKGLAIA